MKLWQRLALAFAIVFCYSCLAHAQGVRCPDGTVPYAPLQTTDAHAHRQDTLCINTTTGVITGTSAVSIGSSSSGSTVLPGMIDASLTLTCDGSTDTTPAFNTLLATAHTQHATILMPNTGYAGRCVLSSAQIIWPNNGDSWSDPPGTIPSQNPMRLTCAAPTANAQLLSAGATVAQLVYGCIVDLKYNASQAKMQFLGMGQVEIDHTTFVDTGSDCAPFFFTSNSSVYFHDNTVLGSTPSNGVTYSCNDVWLLGGSSTTPSGAWNGPFQAYNTKIVDNFFNQIQRLAVGGVFTNHIEILRNRVWSQSGNNTGNKGAIEFPHAVGNVIVAENLIEVPYYTGKAIYFPGGGEAKTLFNSCWDAISSVTCIGASTDGKLFSFGDFYGGSNNGVLAPGDITTNFLGYDQILGVVAHWNGVYNFIEQLATYSPTGCIAMDCLWGDVFWGRLVVNSRGEGKKRLAKVEEIPSTLNAQSYSDNFTRADAGTLGASWTAITGETSLKIASNKALPSAAGAYYGNYYSAGTFLDSQWSQVTVAVNLTAANTYAAPAINIQSGAETYYMLFVGPGSNFCSIRKKVAGANTDLATCPSVPTISAGDQLLLVKNGSTITGYQNGRQIVTVTDSTITGGKAGVVAFANSTITDVQYSAWAGGSMGCPDGQVLTTFAVLPSPIVACNIAGNVQFTALPPVYANNAAAVAGGLAAGAVYRSGADPDVLSVVH